MTSQTEAMFDDMAARYEARGLPAVAVEEIIAETAEAGFLDPWTFSSTATLANGLRVRGLVIKSGMIEREDAAPVENYNPVLTDFEEFTKAAKRVIDEAEYPVDAMDLATRTGLASEAIPYATMKTHLRRVGIWFIPGLGYWRAPQYTDPSGRIVSKHVRSERIKALLECFETQGWPITGVDAERHTGGKVTSRFLSRYAAGSGSETVKGIGSGLFVPADKLTKAGLPMSANVAAALAKLDPETVIDDLDHLRLFRIAMIMERRGLATIRKSRSSRSRKRIQTMRVTLTDAGKKMVDKIARRGRDEF
jgi:hypothetical protein